MSAIKQYVGSQHHFAESEFKSMFQNLQHIHHSAHEQPLSPFRQQAMAHARAL
jgi:hypothetical protein